MINVMMATTVMMVVMMNTVLLLLTLMSRSKRGRRSKRVKIVHTERKNIGDPTCTVALGNQANGTKSRSFRFRLVPNTDKNATAHRTTSPTASTATPSPATGTTECIVVFRLWLVPNTDKKATARRMTSRNPLPYNRYHGVHSCLQVIVGAEKLSPAH